MPRGLFARRQLTVQSAHKAGHNEWVRVRLGRATRVRRIELDMRFFVNNNPESVRIEGRCDADKEGVWRTILPDTFVKQYRGNTAIFDVKGDGAVNTIRVVCSPCGGFNRIKVFGDDH